jgi:hypothetical protein
MKKAIVVGALLTASAMTAVAAPCANNTLANLIAGGACEVGTWSLGGWGRSGVQQQAYGVLPSANEIFVSFTSMTSNTGAAGFSVSFSDAAGGPNFFYAAGHPYFGHMAIWNTTFSVTGAPIVQGTNSVQTAGILPGNDGLINILNTLTDGSTTLGSGSVIYNAAGPQGPNPSTFFNNPANTSALTIVNGRYELRRPCSRLTPQFPSP